MDELEVLLTPSAVPCSNTGSATDPVHFAPQIVTLQLSVVNTGPSPVDLSDATLRIALPVDPGDGGTAAALVLAQPGQPGVPWQAVGAAAATGTLWTIDAGGGACEFDAMPLPATGTTQPGVLAGNGQGSITFVFSDIATVTVLGAAPVIVTLVGAPDGVGIGQSAAVQKTGAGFGIVGFTADPLLVDPGQPSGLTWQVIGAAGCTLTWSPEPNATVTVGDPPVEVTSGQAVPLDTGANPYRATVTGDTEFTLTATGTSTTQASLVVRLAQPILLTRPFPCIVAPHGTFTLSWRYPGAAQPALSWNPPDGAIVTLDGNDLDDGNLVPQNSAASVTLLQSTIFSLSTGAGQAVTAAANLWPVQFHGLTASTPRWDRTTGLQYVGLYWAVDYATSLDVYEQAGATDTSWAFLNHVYYPVGTGQDFALPDVTRFQVTANGEPASVQEVSDPVTPFAAQVNNFRCTPLPLYPENLGSFTWDVAYCTSVSIEADMTYQVPDESYPPDGSTYLVREHEVMQHGDARMATGSLHWLFHGPNLVFVVANLAATGFKPAESSIVVYSVYGFPGAEGTTLPAPSIGANNIRSADPPLPPPSAPDT